MSPNTHLPEAEVGECGAYCCSIFFFNIKLFNFVKIIAPNMIAIDMYKSFIIFFLFLI
jgi:hypothetical protein